MKKYYSLFVLLIYAFTLKATSYVSNASGDWGTSTIWTPNGIPGQSDNITILSGHAISGSTQRLVNNLTINNGGSLTHQNLIIYGILTNNGSFVPTTSSNVQFVATGIVITGGGTNTIPAGNWYFFYNQQIDAGVTINSAGFLYLYNTAGFPNVSLTNNGTISFTSGIKVATGTVPCTFTNGTNASFTTSSVINSIVTLNASATGNTMIFAGTGSYTVNTPSSSTFYNLTTSGSGIKTIPNNMIVSGNFVAQTTTNIQSKTITIGGNWTNNSTVQLNTSTFINFNGSSPQILSKSVGLESMGHVTFSGSGLKTLGVNISLCGLTIASGATLDASVSNYSLFVANNWLNNGGTFIPRSGTVTFDGTNQSITKSGGETFNNVVCAGLNTKTLGSNISCASLTINSGITLDVSASNYSISLSRNWSNSGTFLQRSGTVNFNGTTTQSITSTSVPTFYNLTQSGTSTTSITRNIVVTNQLNISNGVFTSGTYTITGAASLVMSGGELQLATLSTTLPSLSGSYSLSGGKVTFNGAGNQTLRTVTYYSVDIIGSGTKSPTAALNINGNLTISGTLDITASNYAVNCGGNWINNGTFTQRSGTVTFNGNSTVSGSTTTTFNNITISSILTGHSGTMNVAGNWINNGSYANNNGTVAFTGTTPITGSSNTDFNNILISGTLTSHPTGFSLGGNWVNNGVFNNNSGTVTFTGSTTVSGSTTTTFRNIVISGTLTGHATTLNIAGNFSNNGTYNSNSGSLVFNGSTAQVISGSGTATFETFTLSNATGLTVNSSTCNLRGVLILTAGTLTNSGGTFTLVADATRYARIDPISLGCPTCTFSGNFIVQRYIPSRSIGTWADLSSPVANATMLDWDNELFMIYPFGSVDPITNRPTGTNVLAYDEPSAAYYQLSTSTLLTAGKGFEIGLTDDATLTTFSNTTLTTVGTPNYGTFEVLLDYTAGNGPPYPTGYSGENLIGNPYASAISLSDIVITNALTTVDVFDYTTDNYKTLSGSDIIGPYQGFWAYAQSTGASFTITENSKSTNTSTPIAKSIASNNPYLNLTLASADGSHNMAHTLKIACNESASDYWDLSDHPFRKSLNPKAPSITTSADNLLLSINTFNNNHETYVMPLDVNVGVNGKYQISSSGIEHVTDDFKVVLLEDKLSKKFIDLRATNTYAFDATTSNLKERFNIHFSKLETYKPANASITSSSTDGIEISQSQEGNIVRFNLLQTEQAIISITDVVGRKIVENQNIEASNQNVVITLPETFHGMYLITVQSASNKTVKKFIAK